MAPIEDGYRLWLRYEEVADATRLAEYRASLREIVIDAASPTRRAAARELSSGLSGLLGTPVPLAPSEQGAGILVVGTPESSPLVASLRLDEQLTSLGAEGFVIQRATVADKPCTIVAANQDIGLLYGAFSLLRHLQTARALDTISGCSAPAQRYRILQHWDNLDRTVERGYAGFSLWDWHKLPDYVDPRYEDYARANASMGINGSVLTNVNADAWVLTEAYLEKVAALADVFRPYGIRVYLTARFSAPVEIGGLATADPLDRGVARFWREKAREIYRHVPDFGGFVVKANSEGQPGPQDYGRTHADGANVLAEALAPHGGIVLWRAFVYANDPGQDRAKQAYDELVPLDGRFRENAFLQIKNGPVDFQPREPFHPLFSALGATSVVAEFPITQEYLGFATHLVYLGTLFQETLDADTHLDGAGAPVRLRIDGLAGVANVGTDRNWCGHPFAQANWYSFGRLAWDPGLGAEAVAEEWIRMSFSNDERLVEKVLPMMLGSREAAVNYMTPLGLHHLMAWDHHYGPGPWIDKGRADWTSVYFHRADRFGIGFDRTQSGSNAVSQYAPDLARQLGDVDACPEALLLWFHHVPWDRRMRSGRSLWEELCHKYQEGVSFVREMRATWSSLGGLIDEARHGHVDALLCIQENEAIWWRDACVLYFQTFSQRPFPAGWEPPRRSLEEYRNLRHRNVPGSRNH